MFVVQLLCVCLWHSFVITAESASLLILPRRVTAPQASPHVKKLPYSKMLWRQTPPRHLAMIKSANGAPRNKGVTKCSVGARTGITHIPMVNPWWRFGLGDSYQTSIWRQWNILWRGFQPKRGSKWMREKWAPKVNCAPNAQRSPYIVSKLLTKHDTCWKQTRPYLLTPNNWRYGQYSYDWLQAAVSVPKHTLHFSFLRAAGHSAGTLGRGAKSHILPFLPRRKAPSPQKKSVSKNPHNKKKKRTLNPPPFTSTKIPWGVQNNLKIE